MGDEYLYRPVVSSDGTFGNPEWGYLRGRGSLWQFLKESWLTSSGIPDRDTLDKCLPVEKPDAEKLRNPPQSELQYVWIGHATMLYQMNGWNILTDPVWSDRCSPICFMGPKRYRPPPLKIKELPKIDAVVISHNHYDHLDKWTVKALNARYGSSLHWVVPVGLGDWFRSMHCDKITELTWWQSKTLESENKPPLELVSTPAQHWSLRNGRDRNKALWCSWVLISGKYRAFFSGDTGWCNVFKQIGRKYGPFNLAAIAIGAYSPRWFMAPQHIDPQQALDVHRDIRSKLSVGIHWGTFPMGSTEPFLEPREQIELLQKDSPDGKTFITVNHGSINHTD